MIQLYKLILLITECVVCVIDLQRAKEFKRNVERIKQDPVNFAKYEYGDKLRTDTETKTDDSKTDTLPK